MESLTDLYKSGIGPSSSHTIAPNRAALIFAQKYPDADSFKVILFGSLAKTGKGHMTDKAISKAFYPKICDVVFDTQTTELPHPNTMKFIALGKGIELGFNYVYSLGGGSIRFEGEEAPRTKNIYPHNNFTEIMEYCKKENIRIWQYAERFEEKGFFDYMSEIWKTMKRSIEDGLKATGELPGGLHISRKAGYLFNQRHIDESPQTKENRLVCSYAFAVSEQNASGETVVTAPTCGSAGVVPSVMLYMQQRQGFTDTDVIRALETGGIIGNVIKHNASISGAQCGCQAEVGSACSMASAALAELFSMGLEQIEYAAEIAMEHHLGLTCDPIRGLVQIPCIERNAVAAMRAINALSLANFLTNTRKISFDLVVKTMYETGIDMSGHYRETSEGGLAKLYPLEAESSD